MKDSDLTNVFRSFRSRFLVITSCPEEGRRRALPNVKSLSVDIRNHIDSISDFVESDPKKAIIYTELIQGYRDLLESLKLLEKTMRL